MFRFLVDLIIRRAMRTPYSHLTGYMNRYWLRPPAPGRRWPIRIHQTLRSDHERALHDHPWNNISIVLRGGYWEVTPGAYQTAVESASISDPKQDWRLKQIHAVIHTLNGADVPERIRLFYTSVGVRWRGPGAFVRRPMAALHRLVIPAGSTSWSLFAMGPKQREWGFQTTAGWIHNRRYINKIGEEDSTQHATAFSITLPSQATHSYHTEAAS